ncbi:sulfite exporter TauE/SafE family protein [Peijinzhouia sedimentorum]
MIDILWLLAIGLAAGLLSGLLGVGGGIIFISILPEIFFSMGIKEEFMSSLIIANSMAAILAASLVGTITLKRSGRFFPKEILLVGLPALFASVFLQYVYVNTSYYSVDFFNALIFVILLFALWQQISSQFQSKELDGAENLKNSQYVSSGIVTGTASALSGLGGAVVLIPLLNNYFKLPIKKANSISLGVILVISFALTIPNMFFYSFEDAAISANDKLGLIILPVMIPMTFGLLVGAPLGVKLSNKLPSKLISRIFIGFLFIVLSKIVFDYLFI